MKTDDLVMALATGEVRVQRHADVHRYAVAVCLGGFAATLLMLSLLGVRPDLGVAVRLPMFWVKLGYVACLAVASFIAVLRLSRPGAHIGGASVALAVPLLAMWALAASVLAGADAAQRLGLLLGATWKVCPILIAALSMPLFIANLWAMRSLAPTRLTLAGTTAGLLSGTVGALVYCLHCPEMAAPFIGSWYLLGMLIPAGIGAVLGRHVLRW